MITIVFAPPRTGKTCFLTHMACTTAFDRERNRKMQKEIENKRENGFNALDTVPVHCVSANYDITMRKRGYSPRYNRRINPYMLGFANPYVKTHFNFPYECIFIDEAQTYLNSRMSAHFPSWQSRWYEQHGHNDLDIWLATQRPMLIDVNIRELSRFVEIVELEKKYDDFGNVCRLKWHIRRIENSGLFDEYMSSGRRDKSCYTEDTEIADYNVFKCYDSQSCKPKFYDGHLHSDFDYVEAEPIDDTYEAYTDYLCKVADELPENYYIKRGK